MTEPPQASGSVVCNQKFVGSFKVHMVYPRRTINQQDIMDTIVKSSLVIHSDASVLAVVDVVQ